MLAINWRRAHAQRSGFKRLQDSCRVDTLHSAAQRNTARHSGVFNGCLAGDYEFLNKGFVLGGESVDVDAIGQVGSVEAEAVFFVLVCPAVEKGGDVAAAHVVHFHVGVAGLGGGEYDF